MYDYNFKIGENYYKPEVTYIDQHTLDRSKETPPEAQTFAERIASDPIRGKTRGLPYDESKSVFHQPMASLRASSRSRASSLEPDAATGGYHFRGSHRRQSFTGDDEVKFNRHYPRVTFDQKTMEPIPRADLRDKLRKISKDLMKEPSYDPKARQSSRTERHSFDRYTGLPGVTTSSRSSYSYDLPPSGLSSRRGSFTESSRRYEVSPPVSFRSRRTSPSGFSEEVVTTVRSRKLSGGHDPTSGMGLPPLPGRYSSSSYSSRRDDDPYRFESAQNIRDARRMKDSEELTEHMTKMFNRMRSHHLEDADVDVIRKSSALRSSGVDPFEDIDRDRSRQRARMNKFVYGVGKI